MHGFQLTYENGRVVQKQLMVFGTPIGYPIVYVHHLERPDTRVLKNKVYQGNTVNNEFCGYGVFKYFSAGKGYDYDEESEGIF